MAEVNIYFDLETTARGPDYSPEAHFKYNKVVMAGWCIDDYAPHTVHTGTLNNFVDAVLRIAHAGDTPLLIAHNLKFDLKYCIRDYPKVPWQEFTYHCTMTAQYLVSGHKRRFISLEDLCDLYGIPFKKGLDLGALIHSGVDVDDIDKDDLEEYLIEDVRALLKVDQVQSAKNKTEELDLDYILPLARMELNGLPIDLVKTRKLAVQLETSKSKAERKVVDAILSDLQFADGVAIAPRDFKPLAPRTLSYYLTGYPEHGCGGSAKDKPSKQIVFKPGKEPVFDKTAVNTIWKGAKLNPNLGYPMNASVLEAVCSMSDVAANYKLAKDNTKLLNTYIYPFLSEAHDTGGTIHPKLNTCATATGRLSSSKPNGQNIPPIIRNLIVSTQGEMYEIDFSQLEMIGAATLSGDERMLNDILSGMDIHYQTGKDVFAWTSPSDMTKATRRVVKAVNFGLLYGGGPAGIAKNAGVDKKIVSKLIDAFYTRYPDVGIWQDIIMSTVKGNAWVEGTKDGHSYKGSIYQLPKANGGRIFYFQESVSPQWMQRTGGMYSFKPTETKNYPIQGFAGGDIVMKALTILDDVLADTHAVMRMTVHDSIVVDWVAGKENDLHNIMTKVCGIVEKNLGIPVPLKFDIEHDSHWL